MEIDYLYLIRKYRKFVLSLILITAGISIIIISMMPSYYQTSVKIYSEHYINIQILYNAVRSEEIINGIIGKIKLKNILKEEKKDDIRKNLLNAVTAIFYARNNLLEIKIKWENATQAVAIADSLIEELRDKYPNFALSQPYLINNQRDGEIFNSGNSRWQVIDGGSFPQKVLGFKEKIEIIIFGILLSFISAIFLSLIAEIISRSGKVNFSLFSDGLKSRQE